MGFPDREKLAGGREGWAGSAFGLSWGLVVGKAWECCDPSSLLPQTVPRFPLPSQSDPGSQCLNSCRHEGQEGPVPLEICPGPSTIWGWPASSSSGRDRAQTPSSHAGHWHYRVLPPHGPVGLALPPLHPTLAPQGSRCSCGPSLLL